MNTMSLDDAPTFIGNLSVLLDSVGSMLHTASCNSAAPASGEINRASSLIAIAHDACETTLAAIEAGPDYLQPESAVVNVGHVLSEMIDCYEALRDKINQIPGNVDDATVRFMTEAASSIIAYRPFTKEDERRKAQFLREYLNGSMLTEPDQDALIASLMPDSDGTDGCASAFPDPVVELGATIGATMRQMAMLEAKEGKASRDNKRSLQTYISNTRRHVEDAYFDQKDMLSQVKATSLEGAAIQTAQVIVSLERAWDLVPEDRDSHEDEIIRRAVKRMLFSILDVLEAKADKRISETVEHDFDLQHMNPWVPVEDSCPKEFQ